MINGKWTNVFAHLPRYILSVKRVFNLLSAAFELVWKVFCCEMPKRTLKLSVEAVFYLPFRQIYRLARKCVTWIPWKIRLAPSEPQVLKFLTNGDPDTIREEMRSLTATSLRAVTSVQSVRKTLNKWCEQEAENVCHIAAEEKQIIQVLALALKHLKTLKTKREHLDSQDSERVRKLFAYGSLANTSFENQKQGFHRKNDGAQSKQKRDLYKNMLFKLKDAESNVLSVKTNSSKKSEHVLKNSVELLQHGVENAALKQRLAATELVSNSLSTLLDKLGEQFTKMCELQAQLYQGRELLRAVQLDRDQMKAKLQTLEGMIKEEENYLAFESGIDDNNQFSLCNDESHFKEPLSC